MSFGLAQKAAHQFRRPHKMAPKYVAALALAFSASSRDLSGILSGLLNVARLFVGRNDGGETHSRL
jgi:hypothetical protein